MGYRSTEAGDDAGINALSGRYAASDVERAALRLRWLRAYWAACRAAPRGTSKGAVARRIAADARQVEDDSFHISQRSLQRWERAYHAVDPETGKPAHVDGLIDRYRAPDGDDRWPRSSEAIEFFYTLYHTEQRLGIGHCHQVVLRAARRSGWRWASSAGATRAWLRDHDDRELTLVMRWGAKRYAQRAMSYIEQDYSLLAPGELYVCDHHQLKYFVLYRRKPIRPWLTAIIDARTRTLVGWHLGPAPHGDAILQSIRAAFTLWGVPRTVKIDNGRDYTAKRFTGLTKGQVRRYRKQYGRDWKDVLRRERNLVDCTESAWFGLLPELGCRLIYAIAYSPWSKLIERFFRTLSDRHGRTRASWCDTAARLKPEGLQRILARPDRLNTLDAERAAITEWVDIYHATVHTGDAMDGATPLQAWQGQPNVTRTTDAGALDLLLSVRGLYTVGPNGVRVTIGGKAIGYGQYSPALRSHARRQVLVAVDPADIDQAVIMTAGRNGDRRVICRVPRNKRLSPCGDASAQDLREAQAEVNRLRKLKRRAESSAPRRMLDAEQIMERDRRERAAELRATGIDAGSIANQTPVEPDPDPPEFNLADMLDDAANVTPQGDDDGLTLNFSDLVGDPVGEHGDMERDTEVFDMDDLVDAGTEPDDEPVSIEDLLL